MKKMNFKFISNHWIIIAIIVSLTVISFILYFSLQNHHNNLKTGNTMGNKSMQEIEEYILNISSYEASLEVTVQSNKNKNKYQLRQNFTMPNISKQTVLAPSNIAGLETIYDGNNLKINNTQLNASTIYENYPYMTSNYLWLSTFISEYQNLKQIQGKTKLTEDVEQVYMEVYLEETTPYICHKKLLIDKKTGNITKLILQDKNQKTIVYIVYNEITINSLKKEDVLAIQKF